MAMQSVVICGRFVARAIATGFGTELQHRELHLPLGLAAHVRPLHLITASSGISKTLSAAQITPKWCYGDDACFIAAHKSADVIGKDSFMPGKTFVFICPSQTHNRK